MCAAGKSSEVLKMQPFTQTPLQIKYMECSLFPRRNTLAPLTAPLLFETYWHIGPFLILPHLMEI